MVDTNKNGDDSDIYATAPFFLQGRTKGAQCGILWKDSDSEMGTILDIMPPIRSTSEATSLTGGQSRGNGIALDSTTSKVLL